jgi:hypothetical protein
MGAVNLATHVNLGTEWAVSNYLISSVPMQTAERKTEGNRTV